MFQDRRILEFTAFGQVEELIVWDAAPQEKGQARGQFEIAQIVGFPGFTFQWIGFDPE